MSYSLNVRAHCTGKIDATQARRRPQSAPWSAGWTARISLSNEYYFTVYTVWFIWGQGLPQGPRVLLCPAGVSAQTPVLSAIRSVPLYGASSPYPTHGVGKTNQKQVFYWKVTINVSFTVWIRFAIRLHEVLKGPLNNKSNTAHCSRYTFYPIIHFVKRNTYIHKKNVCDITM